MSSMEVASALTNFPFTVEYLLPPAGGAESIFRTVRAPSGCATTLTQSGLGPFQMGSRPWLPSHKPPPLSRAKSRMRARPMIDTDNTNCYCNRFAGPVPAC